MLANCRTHLISLRRVKVNVKIFFKEDDIEAGSENEGDKDNEVIGLKLCKSF